MLQPPSPLQLRSGFPWLLAVLLVLSTPTWIACGSPAREPAPRPSSPPRAFQQQAVPLDTIGVPTEMFADPDHRNDPPEARVATDPSRSQGRNGAGQPPAGSTQRPAGVRPTARSQRGNQAQRAPQADAGIPEDPADLPVVARLELELPPAETFVLRATLPVPVGFEVGAPEESVLAIVDRTREGQLVPAQWDVLVRRADGSPEVLELCAPLRRSQRDRPGNRVRYEVVQHRAPLAAGPSIPPSARVLFGGEAPHPPRLRSRDVHGNVYEFDIGGWPEVAGFGSARTLAKGPATRRRRVAGVLVPTETSGEGEPLPHLLGVHAYWHQWAGDPRVSLDLRIHNGTTSGARPPGPLEGILGIAYWDSLELILPPGWDALPLVSDPFFGPARQENGETVVPIVRGFPDRPGGAHGPLHVMGPGAQFERRLTLGPAKVLAQQPGHAALEGLAFAVPANGLWSWFHPETASFFPQRSVLGTMEKFARGDRGLPGLRSDLRRSRDALKVLLETGDSNGGDVKAEVMGWAHPWYVKAQNGTGGVAIQFYEGHDAAAAASVPGIERLMLQHRMNLSRQPQAMFDLAGDPVGYFQWRDEEGSVPFDFRTNGGMVARGFRLPATGGEAPSSQVLEVHAAGLRPPYDRGDVHKRKGQIPNRDDNIWSFAPHDGQHMIRYTKNPKALVWLAADAMAKDDLALSAELFRLQFHEGPHRAERWSPGVTLRVMEGQVAQHPNMGAHIGRDQAWGIDAVSAYFSVAPPGWRKRHAAWFEKVARFLLKAAMPSGVIMRSPNPKVLYSDKYEAAQTYQTIFLMHAMRTMNESILKASNDRLARQLERLIVRTCDYLYFGPIWASAPSRDGKSRSGPREAFAVGFPRDWETPPFCDEDHWGADYMPEDGFGGGVEFFYCWAALEYAYLASDPDAALGNRFLQRTLDCWTGAKNHAELVRNLFAATQRVSSDHSQHWIGLMGRLQALGVR